MAASDGSAMADPYALKDGAVPPPTGGLGPAFGGLTFPAGANPGPTVQPDFLFPENFEEDYRRSWGERLTFHIGSAYLTGATPRPPASSPGPRAPLFAGGPPPPLAPRRAIPDRSFARACNGAGLTTGGSYGLYEGLKASQGERQRIRINSVLNSMGKRGPGWGNGLGAMALMWSVFETIAYTSRGVDDMLNPAGAAVITGGLFRITAGPKVAVTWGVGLGALAAAGSFVTKQFSQRGMLKNFV